MVTNKVSDIRTDKDFTQVSFSKLVGISRQALHSIETGKSIPSVEVALKMAFILNVKIEKLFFLSDESNSVVKKNSKVKQSGAFTLFDHSLLGKR